MMNSTHILSCSQRYLMCSPKPWKASSLMAEILFSLRCSDRSSWMGLSAVDGNSSIRLDVIDNDVNDAEMKSNVSLLLFKLIVWSWAFCPSATPPLGRHDYCVSLWRQKFRPRFPWGAMIGFVPQGTWLMCYFLLSSHSCPTEEIQRSHFRYFRGLTFAQYLFPNSFRT